MTINIPQMLQVATFWQHTTNDKRNQSCTALTFTMVWCAKGVGRLCHCFSRVTRLRWLHTYLQWSNMQGRNSCITHRTRQSSGTANEYQWWSGV